MIHPPGADTDDIISDVLISKGATNTIEVRESSLLGCRDCGVVCSIESSVKGGGTGGGEVVYG